MVEAAVVLILTVEGDYAIRPAEEKVVLVEVVGSELTAMGVPPKHAWGKDLHICPHHICAIYRPTVLRLTGMREALLDQAAMADIEELAFEERLGLLFDREATARADRRLRARLRNARFRQSATVEDLDYHTPRGLDRTLMNALIGGGWIKKHPKRQIIQQNQSVANLRTGAS